MYVSGSMPTFLQRLFFFGGGGPSFDKRRREQTLAGYIHANCNLVAARSFFFLCIFTCRA
jgi:hypothetical protein